MIIHQYDIRDRELKHFELEGFEEKEKYYARKSGMKKNIAKELIGKVINTVHGKTVYLTEPDEKKAKEAFTEFYETKMEIIEERYAADKEAITMILKNLQTKEKGESPKWQQDLAY